MSVFCTLGEVIHEARNDGDDVAGDGYHYHYYGSESDRLRKQMSNEPDLICSPLG